MRRRAHAAIAVVVALATLALVPGCSLAQLRDVFGGVIHPAIVPVRGVQGTRDVAHEFSFEGERVTLRVPVDSAIYAGARSADKRAIFLSGERPAGWVGDYYRAFVDEEHQERFFADLIGALHAIREERGLDDARYAELVTAMAQSLEYRVDAGNLAPKFPIETFADGFGDCDDKTLLAVGVLAREGYDVAVFFFGPEKHVSMGLRAPSAGYAGEYAYVEMTEASIVGMVPASLDGGVRIESTPDVVRIGGGARAYDAGGQVALIARRMAQLRVEIKRLGERIARDSEELAAERIALEEAKRTLQASGAVTEEDVRRLNERVDDYNTRAEESNRTVNRHNDLVELQRFAIEQATNRPEVYRRLSAERL